MTDLEMIRLCAEAMALNYAVATDGLGGQHINETVYADATAIHVRTYDPLHDDAQAMALVKKFKLLVNNGVGHSSTDIWHVQTQDDRDESVECQTLNRAIVECVAKMQAASSKAGEQR